MDDVLGQVRSLFSNFRDGSRLPQTTFFHGPDGKE